MIILRNIPRFEFIELLDTPTTYSGSADQFVVVNTGETGLEFSSLPLDDYVLRDGSRSFTGTISGVDPTASEHLTTKQYVDDAISTLSGSVVLDHGALTGLSDDDHLQYVPTNASRGFTSTVSGINPTESYHLATKFYIDTEITSLSGSIVLDHGGLTGLSDDDHLQYVPRTGARGFTSTVSGVDPTEDYHLTTKLYVDTEVATLSGSIVNDHRQ